jgi:hypothetical protein
MRHIHLWTEMFGDGRSLATHSNTFASTAACAPAGELVIQYNVSAAISITARFSPLNKNQHQAQDHLIETHRKRGTSWTTAALDVVSWRASSTSMRHIHLWTETFGDESSLATHSNALASTTACAPSGDLAIRYNISATILITARFSPLNNNQHLDQEHLI